MLSCTGLRTEAGIVDQTEAGVDRGPSEMGY